MGEAGFARAENRPVCAAFRLPAAGLARLVGSCKTFAKELRCLGACLCLAICHAHGVVTVIINQTLSHDIIIFREFYLLFSALKIQYVMVFSCMFTSVKLTHNLLLNRVVVI
jgi:hypothetical protein